MRGRITTLSVSAESGVQRVVDEVVGQAARSRARSRASPRRRAQAAGVPAAGPLHDRPARRDAAGDQRDARVRARPLRARPAPGRACSSRRRCPGTRLAAMARSAGARCRSSPTGARTSSSAPSIETDARSRSRSCARFKWTFDQRLAASQGPKKVIMNVTYKCNNRCTFCATGTRTQFDGDLERQRELLVKYRKLGVTLLDFDGGEPTLNPNLFALVRFARTIGYERINVTTNGAWRATTTYAEQARAARASPRSSSRSTAPTRRRTRRTSASPRRSIRPARASATSCALAPPGVELGANITITKSQPREARRRRAARATTSACAGSTSSSSRPFGRATSSVAPDTAEAADEAMRVIDAFEDRMKFQVINLPFCFMPGYEEYLDGRHAQARAAHALREQRGGEPLRVPRASAA